jgi:hypothetical protein
MGGRSSKVDTYVLHAEPEKVEMLQPYQARSSKKGGTAPLSSQNSTILTEKELNTSTKLSRGKSTAKFEKQNSSAILEKQSSVATLGTTGRRPSQNTMIKTGSFISNQSPSTKMSRKTLTSNNTSTCSVEYPWLLKNGEFIV